ncbi:hypothetical protein CY34DRAFT_799248 [Suillus luteus UH-Slu-Lm8-n1]|uniref:Uncharacterized protein n=1 Tax=Suillus luteus UH-Slu-Lm8-n1 TaxID=930992 RepID=A0A0D0BXD4_9AGAM|nr:hypothetical protein CY34DRAFT_799248 [Suillus luteus UH-Slu-Lm8-n1]
MARDNVIVACIRCLSFGWVHSLHVFLVGNSDNTPPKFTITCTCASSLVELITQDGHTWT